MREAPTPDHPLRLAIIIGSTRQGRFAPTVANWFAGEASRREDMSVDVIDLAEAQLPDVLTREPYARGDGCDAHGCHGPTRSSW